MRVAVRNRGPGRFADQDPTVITFEDVRLHRRGCIAAGLPIGVQDGRVLRQAALRRPVEMRRVGARHVRAELISSVEAPPSLVGRRAADAAQNAGRLLVDVRRWPTVATFTFLVGTALLPGESPWCANTRHAPAAQPADVFIVKAIRIFITAPGADLFVANLVLAVHHRRRQTAEEPQAAPDGAAGVAEARGNANRRAEPVHACEGHSALVRAGPVRTTPGSAQLAGGGPRVGAHLALGTIGVLSAVRPIECARARAIFLAVRPLDGAIELVAQRSEGVTVAVRHAFDGTDAEPLTCVDA